jgi:thymidylate synthase (FAD)
MGDDLAIVNSARISLDNSSLELGNSDAKLLNFLMKNRHGTPFEAVEFHYQIRAPITVIRQIQRHRISSFNEVSGRYVEMKLEAYVPDHDAIREQVGRPGHYTYNTLPKNDIRADHCVDVMIEAYDQCFNRYEELLDIGIAKELARNVLPLGLYSEFRYKTNARSLMNFLSLRNHPECMYETRKIAEAMEEMFKDIVPVTHSCFVKNGRIAP